MQRSMNSPMAVMKVTVNHHPGVMSHVCGLFARRAFNLEGIVVTPEDDGTTAVIWLVVHEDSRMEQMVKQVGKLHDVLEVSISGIDSGVFEHLSRCMEGMEKSPLAHPLAGDTGLCMVESQP